MVATENIDVKCVHPVQTNQSFSTVTGSGCDLELDSADSSFNMLLEPSISAHRHGNNIDDETKHIIEELFTRDDNSRMTTGKKQTITKNKVKEQKRLLLDTMINLHEKFSSEYPKNNVSYATFTRHRQFWVRQPTAKDRETCACKRHENIQLAVDRLHQLGLLSSKRADDLLVGVCCNLDNKQCMFRECPLCLNKINI